MLIKIEFSHLKNGNRTNIRREKDDDQLIKSHADVLLSLLGIILLKNTFSILAPSVINIGNKLINPILRLRNANQPNNCLNHFTILNKI